MTRRKTNENLADMAGNAEADHELQMAREQLYKIAQYAIKLHEMTKQITDPKGLEPWQSAKLTKASDYLSAVYHNLEYNLKYKPTGEPAGELGAESGEIAVGEAKKKKYGKMKETSDPYMQDLRKRLKLAEQKKTQEGQDASTRPLKRGDDVLHYKTDAHGKVMRQQNKDGTYTVRWQQTKTAKDHPRDELVHIGSKPPKLKEKAESQAQQKAAGAALAAKRGDTPKSELKGAAKDMAKMSKSDLEDIAGTKHKGLPKKKSESTNEGRRTGMAAAGRAASGWGGMGRSDRDSFKRREMEKELGHETKPKRQAPTQSGPVYLMIDGKVWKKEGKPVEFKDKQHASNVGRKILAKNPGKDIKMTNNPNPK